MLHPRFFCPPNDIVIKPPKSFQVVFYCKCQQFTVVRWRLNYGFDGPNGSFEEGESLYKNHQLIFSERLAGSIQLGTPQNETAYSRARKQTADPRNRIDPNLGRFGISAAVAGKLHDVRNRVYFRV